MINKSKWVSNYRGLTPDNQLEVAEAISKELRDNETIYDESEYDKRKSKIIRIFFDRILLHANQDKELEKITTILYKFEELSQDNQNKATNEVLKIIAKYLNIQERENNENICKEQGHLFNEWKERCWTTKEVYWDAGPQGYIDVEHKEWHRACERCGFVDKVDLEPQELINAREEKNRKVRIKKLESELSKLKK